jgi:hypothetical protein
LLPIKTPLSKTFSATHENPNGLKQDEEFTPTQFVKDVRKRGFELGIVIDLTFTDRYYRPEVSYDTINHVIYGMT